MAKRSVSLQVSVRLRWIKKGRGFTTDHEMAGRFLKSAPICFGMNPFRLTRCKLNSKEFHKSQFAIRWRSIRGAISISLISLAVRLTTSRRMTSISIFEFSFAIHGLFGPGGLFTPMTDSTFSPISFIGRRFSQEKKMRSFLRFISSN